jgi:hypothetical protein
MFKLCLISGTFLIVRLLLAPFPRSDVDAVVNLCGCDQFTPRAFGDFVNYHLGRAGSLGDWSASATTTTPIYKSRQEQA